MMSRPVQPDAGNQSSVNRAYFFYEKNLDFYGTMCHILINGTGFTHRPPAKHSHLKTQASLPTGH
jgi:hypothetical protein